MDNQGTPRFTRGIVCYMAIPTAKQSEAPRASDQLKIEKDYELSALCRATTIQNGCRSSLEQVVIGIQPRPNQLPEHKRKRGLLNRRHLRLNRRPPPISDNLPRSLATMEITMSARRVNVNNKILNNTKMKLFLSLYSSIQTLHLAYTLTTVASTVESV